MICTLHQILTGNQLEEDEMGGEIPYSIYVDIKMVTKEKILHTQNACRIYNGSLLGKGKVKLSLCLTKHDAMKTYWGLKV